MAYRDDDPGYAPSYVLPDVVKDFIRYFYKHFKDGNVAEIENIYEHHFPKLTERYFKDKNAYQPWPTADVISDLVGGDEVFKILYRELYYRHLYSKLPNQLTVDHRFESYENYCDLFNQILDADQPVEWELPTQWLWDIVDEFIYQFRLFCQLRSFGQHRAKLGDDVIALLRDSPSTWNVHIVLNVLHKLIEKSNINDQLEASNKGEDPNEVAGDFGCRTMYKMLGYFSIVGLLRLHTMLGDYVLALRVMEHMRPGQLGLHNKVPAYQITIAYYTGFCYLMSRRYQDAVRTFANILFYIVRTQSFQSRSSGYDNIQKQRDQIFSLLAIAMTISPQRIDEGVHHQMLEKCGNEKGGNEIQRMQKGDEAAFRDLFAYGCPKFLSPVAPSYDAPPGSHTDPMRLQLKLFLQTVKQQLLQPTIRSYLKLYRSISIQKLATFLGQDVDTLRVALHQCKHLTNQLVWVEGSPLSGERAPSTDIDFYVDGDMVHIADIKVARSYGNFFIHQIQKMSKE